LDDGMMFIAEVGIYKSDRYSESAKRHSTLLLVIATAQEERTSGTFPIIGIYLCHSFWNNLEILPDLLDFLKLANKYFLLAPAFGQQKQKF
jgi:hypothetical protein